MRVRLETTAQEIELSGAPLGSGGEAAIYVLPDTPFQVAKLYHRPKPEHADKLQAMLAAPPLDPMAGTGHNSIAWPTDRLLAVEPLPKGVEAGAVVGYVMPRVDKVRLIQEFYNPKSRLQVCPLFHYGYLLRTARNLAAAIRALHERGYVIGDLNESNLLVTNQALVTLVDTDSFQVPAAQRMFRCTVGKPEYTPPELQGARFGEVDRSPEHDAFGLGVLIFQLLMQGTHPFAGIYTGAGEPAPIPKRIAAGHWPYAQGRQWYQHDVPFKPSPLAPPWSVLPPQVQEVMRRCFEEGHVRPPARPTTAEWQRALQEAEKDLVTCLANTQHLYHRSLTACPWCVLAQQQGRDLFPSPQDLKPQAPVTIKATGPATMMANAEQIPTVIAVPEPPSLATRLAERAANINYARIARWTAGAAAFMIAAVAVAYGSWKLTRKPRPDAPVRQVAQEQVVQPKDPPPLGTVPFKGVSAVGEILDVSRDGRLALVGRGDLAASLQVWNVETDERVHTFAGLPGGVRCAAFSPDGRFALSGSTGLFEPNGWRPAADYSLRLWDVETGKEVRRFEGHTRIVLCVAFSPDGRLALSGSVDLTARLWDVQTGKELKRFQERDVGLGPPAIARVDFLPNGRILTNGQTLWDSDSGNRLRSFDRRLVGNCLAVSADGRRALTGSGNVNDIMRGDRAFPPMNILGDVCLWDLETGKDLRHFRTPEMGPVNCVALSPDGRHALSGHGGIARYSNRQIDFTVRRWDLESGKELEKLTSFNKPLYRVVFDGNNHGVATQADGVATRLTFAANAPER